tara:strand:+ start:1130 stop:2227 length:1098 start_codon:yes stop_codon:yes gene_type:complete
MTTQNKKAIYDQSIYEVAEQIHAVGSHLTVMVRGHMGTGKSSILKVLAKMNPNHVIAYVDCTTLTDSADLFMVKYSEDGKTFTSVPFKDLGLHLPDQPIILMFDELGKCSRSVLLACNRIILERKHGNLTLHPDSLVFATTNLGSEGLGDLLPAHSLDRVTTVTMRKPDNIEAIEYGIDNDYDPALLGWFKETPQLFYGFERYEDPEENPYIFHPDAVDRESFFTPRGGERTNYILKQRASLSDPQLTSLLIGTIGYSAAMNLATFIALADKLPTLDQIKGDPMTAPIPDGPSAICMVVYRALATIEREWVDPWLTYMNRLPKEAQGLFVNGVRSKHYSRRDIVSQNKQYGDWCQANNYMFSTDK